MRITNNMMVNTLLNNLTNNMNRMSKYQDQLATGKQVIRASDDPVATSSILKFKSDIAALNQYEKNTGDSLAWLEVTESAISDVGEVLQRMRELTVQAANGTNTVEDTQKMAAEIEQLKKHIITDGNFSYAGRYAFTGYQTDKPLFNEDGTYAIDITQNDIDNKTQLQYQVSIAQNMEVTTNGLEVFGVNTVGAPFVPEALLPTDPTAHAVTITGAAATKSTFTTAAAFNLSGTYPPGSLSVTLGTTYVIPPAGVTLDGAATPLSKDDVLACYQGVLGNNADVFFNTEDKLVVKSTTYGNIGAASAGYAFVAGAAVSEAVVAPAIATIPEPYTEGGTFFLTVNGVRNRINIPDPIPPATLTHADFKAALTTAVTDKFGTSVTVTGVLGQIGFSTNGTALGVTPSITVEHVVAKRSELMVDIDNFLTALNTGDQAGMNTFLGQVDTHMNRILSVRADIGARVNRMELIANRISDNTISFTTMLSDAQDADMGGVIMFLKNAENVYKAALSTGSKVIQPSLIDFLR